jgi:hypothetical protein
MAAQPHDGHATMLVCLCEVSRPSIRSLHFWEAGRLTCSDGAGCSWPGDVSTRRVPDGRSCSESGSVARCPGDPGLGGALVFPATLSLVNTLFAGGPDRSAHPHEQHGRKITLDLDLCAQSG